MQLMKLLWNVEQKMETTVVFQMPRGCAHCSGKAEVAFDFPQGCGLHSIPSQLRSASRLQHLRIGGDGAVLRIEPADLETFSAMRSLTYLSLAKVIASTACDILPK
jgi:hypothetical protein